MKTVEVPSLDIDHRLYHDKGRNIPPRGRLERRIVANLIDHLARAGWHVAALDDGESTEHVADMKAAMELIFNLDVCWLYFGDRQDEETLQGVQLVLGNGVDLISNWHSGDDAFDAALKAFDPEQFA